MKRHITITAVALSLMAMQSCDPRPLVVEDLSKVKTVKLVLDTTADPWLACESRRCTVEIFPETAIALDFEVHVSNPELFNVEKGKASNEFIVTATGGGLKLGEVYASIWASAGGVESEKKEFCLMDKRPKPTAPAFKLTCADAASPSNRTDINEVIRTDCFHHYALSFELTELVSADGISVELQSLDKTVATVERTGARTWMVHSLRPGRSNLTLTITDSDSNEFQFNYIYASYGHVTFDAEFFTPFGVGGFRVNEYPYESTMAHVHLSTFIVANIYDMSAETITRNLDPVSVYVPLDADDNDMILECSDALDEIYNHYATDQKGQKVPYHPVEARLTFVFTLDDPFIIIDDVTDDLDRDQQKYSDTAIIAFFRQEGVEYFLDSEQ